MVKKTDLGRQIEEFIVQKIYVPDSFVIEVLQKYIAGIDSDKHMFVEGFPKTIFQAKYLIGSGIVPDGIIFLKYNEAQVLKSLSWVQKREIR